MRWRGDNRVDDGGESGSEVRVAVIAAANAIAMAAAMEVQKTRKSDCFTAKKIAKLPTSTNSQKIAYVAA